MFCKALEIIWDRPGRKLRFVSSRGLPLLSDGGLRLLMKHRRNIRIPYAEIIRIFFFLGFLHAHVIFAGLRWPRERECVFDAFFENSTNARNDRNLVDSDFQRNSSWRMWLSIPFSIVRFAPCFSKNHSSRFPNFFFVS